MYIIFIIILIKRKDVFIVMNARVEARTMEKYIMRCNEVKQLMHQLFDYMMDAKNAGLSTQIGGEHWEKQVKQHLEKRVSDAFVYGTLCFKPKSFYVARQMASIKRGKKYVYHTVEEIDAIAKEFNNLDTTMSCMIAGGKSPKCALQELRTQHNIIEPVCKALMYVYGVV